MSPKDFQIAKMGWLVAWAGHSAATVRSLAAAVACADQAWSPTGEVKSTQKELAASLGKPQSAISAGCATLIEHGFLTVRRNGNRSIYSLNFDLSTRSAAPKKAPRGIKRKSAAADTPISTPPDKGIEAPNIRRGGSSLSAAADEHYIPIPIEGTLETFQPITDAASALNPAPPIDLITRYGSAGRAARPADHPHACLGLARPSSNAFMRLARPPRPRVPRAPTPIGSSPAPRPPRGNGSAFLVRFQPSKIPCPCLPESWKTP